MKLLNLAYIILYHPQMQRSLTEMGFDNNRGLCAEGPWAAIPHFWEYLHRRGVNFPVFLALLDYIPSVFGYIQCRSLLSNSKPNSVLIYLSFLVGSPLCFHQQASELTPFKWRLHQQKWLSTSRMYFNPRIFGTLGHFWLFYMILLANYQMVGTL